MGSLSPNPNLLTTHNNDSGVEFNSMSEFPNIDTLDFIPAAAGTGTGVAQQQQQQQRQFQQYLRTPKSASSPKFQLTATNFSNQTTPAFGSVATFSNNSFLPDGSDSDLLQPMPNSHQLHRNCQLQYIYGNSISATKQ